MLSVIAVKRNCSLCELLGMNANVPTDICFSFAGLMRRGGATGPHRDGWGIALYEGKGCRTFHDPKPSAHSEIARFVREYPIKSRIVICHIRRANRGRIALENTHPFTRELWGRSWSFAHNGQLRGIKKWPNAHFRPIGTTDSEHAFCWLMDQLRERWQDAPPPRALYLYLAELCGTLAEHGVFNVLLSDSVPSFRLMPPPDVPLPPVIFRPARLTLWPGAETSKVGLVPPHVCEDCAPFLPA